MARSLTIRSTYKNFISTFEATTIVNLRPVVFTIALKKIKYQKINIKGVQGHLLKISKHYWGTSLVAQWLRIHRPMQGTQVQALVREDPTCCEATKPVHHNDWACTPEPTTHNYWAHVPQLLKPTCLEPVLCNKRSHRNENPAHHQQRVAPLTTTRESLHAATKTQNSQK